MKKLVVLCDYITVVNIVTAFVTFRPIIMDLIQKFPNRTKFRRRIITTLSLGKSTYKSLKNSVKSSQQIIVTRDNFSVDLSLKTNYLPTWNFEWGVSFQRVEWNDNQSRPDKISTNCQIFDIDIFSIRCWRPGLFMIPFFYFRHLLRELNNFRDTYELIRFLNLQVNMSNLSNSIFLLRIKILLTLWKV